MTMRHSKQVKIVDITPVRRGTRNCITLEDINTKEILRWEDTKLKPFNIGQVYDIKCKIAEGNWIKHVLFKED